MNGSNCELVTRNLVISNDGKVTEVPELPTEILRLEILAHSKTGKPLSFVMHTPGRLSLRILPSALPSAARAAGGSPPVCNLVIHAVAIEVRNVSSVSQP